VDLPLPWERSLWRSRPLRPIAWLRGERYFLTDFRLVRACGARVDEIVLHDIGDVQRTESAVERVFGLSTLVVHARRRDVSPIVLSGIRRGAPLAALLELLSGDPSATTDAESIRAALDWTPQPPEAPYRQALGGLVVAAMVVFAVVVGLHGKASPIVYASDDAIEPGGLKKDRDEIVRFMRSDVMPWARAALAPLKGGADRVTCQTCHSSTGEARGWQMPAVAALPLPILRERGWELYNGGMDAQMRNAIYGYVAESDNQAKAAYMREVVVPGMARLLHRPAYDFTRTYEYNRARRALGCYHCHRVK